MPLAIEHADHPALGQQLELVQAFVAMCRNRPLVLAGSDTDRLEVQTVFGPEVADFTKRDDEKWCGRHVGSIRMPEIYMARTPSSMALSPRTA